MTTREMYGLKHKKTGNLCSFYYSSDCVDDGGGPYGDTAFFLDSPDNENVWLVASRDVAEQALKNNTEWYNAGYNTPSHGIDLKDYEVVKVTLTF